MENQDNFTTKNGEEINADNTSFEENNEANATSIPEDVSFNDLPPKEETEPKYETITFNDAQEREEIEEEEKTPNFSDFNFQNDNPFERVEFSPVKPENNTAQMSKGLKVFCGIMALVILLTCSCVGGFFFGKNSVGTKTGKTISVDLASKPKNTDESTAAEVYENVKKSVVGIEVYNDAGDLAEATGVVYSKDGYIVTNDHIYGEIAAPKFKIYDYEGNVYDATYVAGDSISDLALLKADGNGFTVPEFGDSNDIVCGENVVAIGRPSGARTDSSVTKGIISLTKRRMSTTSSYTATLIQTDSAINPGSSGGALVNMYGQIIGITSSKLAGVNYDDTGFAIPTVTMKRVVSQLSKNGKVEDRAKLGITYTEITPVMVSLGQFSTTGLYIASVSEDSDLAGKVTQGDIITHIGGEKITVDDMVLDVIENSYAGDKITLTIMDSSGSSKDYTITLKANVGESSYHTTETESEIEGGNGNGNGNKNGNGNMPNGDPSDGTFDFPDGE